MNTNKINPVQSTNFEVGAILIDTWGWEQTNKDFYCIIKRSGHWVTILPMTKKKREIGYQTMTTENLPDEVDYSAKPIRKKVFKRGDKEIGFTLRNYSGGGWCDLWEGKPETATHYA